MVLLVLFLVVRPGALAVENAIVRENRLAGSPSTEWDVNGAGSDDIVGFATAMSYLPGSEVQLKISSAESSFEVDIYRLGWYGGLGARKVGSATVLSGESPQPECADVDEVVDCGIWGVRATYKLAPEAASGLYFARMTLANNDAQWRADASKTTYDPVHVQEGRDPLLAPEEGPQTFASKFKLENSLERPRASLAFFVVKAPDADEKYDLLFQTSDTTWHAYNGWGGLTTYGSFEYPLRHAPNRTFIAEAARTERAYKRSYNTPLVTRDYRAVNAPFGAEYPAIRFLEKLGLNMHYISGSDMADSKIAESALKRSKAYLSVGHDEYWSYEQRKAVEDAQNLYGTHTFFWSGNEAYWAVRFEDSTVGETKNDRRTMVCHKETQSLKKLDPLPLSWTGTFRDARPLNPRGPMPENALTGTMFAANAQRNDPLVVDPIRFGAHRLWRHTSVRRALLNNETKPIVLYQGLLGHEWDSPVDNGVSPPGLQLLSSTKIHNVQAIQDWGATFDSGSATHSLVVHRKPSGAIVFGAGTVQWAWGLDEHHDVNDPQRANKYNIRIAQDLRGPCDDIQQFTVNLFSDAKLDMPHLAINFPHLVTGESSTTDNDNFAPTATVDDVRRLDNDIVTARGRASDLGGGVVASVEIAWRRHDETQQQNNDDAHLVRWFMTDVDALATETLWSFTWGDQDWHRFHGPPPPLDLTSSLCLRVTDDLGNLAVYHGLTVLAKDGLLRAGNEF